MISVVIPCRNEARHVERLLDSPCDRDFTDVETISVDGDSDDETAPLRYFRRATWEAVGGFNDELLMNEDYEFYLRIRQRGGRIYFDPNIRYEYFTRPTFKLLAQHYLTLWLVEGANMLRWRPSSIRVR